MSNSVQTGSNGSSSYKKAITGLIIAIVVVVFLIGTVLIVMFTRGSGDKYTDYIDAAVKYADDMDFDSAVSSYWSAIDEEPYKETAYISLGNLYNRNEQYDYAYSVYKLGYEKTGSGTLYELMYNVQRLIAADKIGEVKDDEGKKKTYTPVLNRSLMLKFANYDYSDYVEDFGRPTLTETSDGGYKVVFNDLGAELLYYNTASDNHVIDTVNKKPYDAKMPNEISVPDLTLIFGDFGETMTIDNLRLLEVTDVMLARSSSDKARTVVRFVFSESTMEIECDADGSFTAQAWNKLVPPREVKKSAGEEVRLHKLMGVVIDAVTGKGVPNAKIEITPKEDAAKKDPIDPVYSEYTGAYVFNDIPADDYILKVTAEGYIPDYFEVTVFENSDYTEKELPISPELKLGQIRIVLTWQSFPLDLDSYLEGTSSSGSHVFTGYYSRECRVGDTLIASLDVDDQDGYGPETTTIYDIGGSYEFRVVDFYLTNGLDSTGATVKVYTADSSSPIEINCPGGMGNYWIVCAINNGKVDIINRHGDESLLREVDGKH